MSVLFYHVDAFAEKPFEGNPAGICLLDKEKSEEWMQKVAGEINLPATSFVRKVGDEFLIRWFAPKLEIKLCGHGSLAAGFVLFQNGMAEGDEITFTYPFGSFKARKEGEEVVLQMPVIAYEEIELPEDIKKAILTPYKASYIHSNGYLLELASEEDVRNIQLDFQALSAFPKVFIVTAKASEDKPYDIVSRVFVPFSGNNEDPVTGSAHCCLGLYWQGRLGKNEILAYQASERGGFMKLNLIGDGQILIKGKAIVLFESVFNI